MTSSKLLVMRSFPPNANFEDEWFEAFKELASQCTRNGSLLLGQVSHPGHQVAENVQRHPLSTSHVQLKAIPIISCTKCVDAHCEVRFHPGWVIHKTSPNSHSEIQHIISGFAYAAEFLYKVGFDGIELHGGYGYMLLPFLSRTTNKRNDRYWGSLENCTRIIFETATEIRCRVPPSFIVSIKLNSAEFRRARFDPEECKRLCEQLEA